MARTSGSPDVIPRGGVVIAVVLLLLPGAFFFAKGALEVADRFAARTVSEATLLDTEVFQTYNARGGSQNHYRVTGVTATGESFAFEDRRVYDVASGRTPLAVRVETSALTGRVLAVRVDGTVIGAVGGAGGIMLAVLGMGLGGLLAGVPLIMPWRTRGRRKAREKGVPAPPPDWGALAIVAFAAVVVVAATWAWDLLR